MACMDAAGYLMSPSGAEPSSELMSPSGVAFKVILAENHRAHSTAVFHELLSTVFRTVWSLLIMVLGAKWSQVDKVIAQCNQPLR